ncbi:MAG TPA: VWA domain-containing protein, partial [Dehalococcoidia bacterium]
MTFRFADPAWLALLALLPLLVLALRRARAARPAILFSSTGLARDLPRGWRARLLPAVPALRLAAAALVILALARPQRGEALGTVPGQGIDIVLLLDISSSMDQPAGPEGSKLDVAKAVLKEFVQGRESDRIGLVAFQKETYLASPLTLDYRALQRLVDDLNSELLPDGTAIGLAMAEGLNALRESEARSRIMILLTDGENNEHLVEPEDAAAMAASLRVRTYTIGFGREGDNLDEETLQRIAETSGGRYYHAGDAGALREIYEEIGRLETSRVERDRFTRYRELAPYLLVPAVGVVLLELALAA